MRSVMCVMKICNEKTLRKSENAIWEFWKLKILKIEKWSFEHEGAQNTFPWKPTQKYFFDGY